MANATLDDATVKRLALGDFPEELSRTRAMLDRVPDEHLDWRPHDKSYTLHELAAHLVNLLFWQLVSIQQPGFDLSAIPADRQLPADRAALLASFDAQAETVKRAVDEASIDDLLGDWTLRQGEHVIFTLPRVVVFRSFGISHMAHHRGQLSVYLRMLDVPLPPIYGPTADESG
jgi:uncharacterized damage-inducible protein DinB